MDDLENLKYKELRKLAKDLGIKTKGKADKLIREIRKIQNDCFNANHAQPEPEFHSNTTDISKTKTEDTSDDEIMFVKNPERQATTDIGDFLENHTNRNSIAELEDCEKKLDQLSEHNQTVDFEDLEEAGKTETKVLDYDSPLDATYEVLPDVDEPEDKSMKDDSIVDKNNSLNDQLDRMKPEMTNEEMKAELMAAIDKKVQKRRTTNNKNSNTVTEFDNCVNMVLSSKKESSTATPAKKAHKKWEKIHQKMFQKFDSLDVYLEKKNKRAQRLLTPARFAKEIPEKNKNRSGKQSSQLLQSKIPKCTPVTSFIPKVTSVKEICLQFTDSSSKLPKSVKKVQEAPFMSPRINEKKAFTPFNFTSNKTTPSSGIKRQVFDLQASLAKPITWKQHKGKLKPLEFGAPEPPTFKKGLKTSIEENRKNRRRDVIKGRASRRENLLNARRNVNSKW